jgi:hypothetical protein
MKKKLLLASLLLALIAPAAQAVGLNGSSTPEPITIPSLIPPTRTEGGFRGNLNLALNSSPRSLRNDGGLKYGVRIPSRLRGPYVDPAVDNGNGGDCPSVPEPQGFAMALAAGILGLGFTGYTAHQRRRVHGAA